MELHQLRYVLAVAECGSFTAAATRLYLAQPSLSVQIRKLERELRIELFDRRGGHTRLTPAGERFLEHASRALAELDLAREAAQNTGTDDGCMTVTLGVLPSIAAGLLPDLLQRLRADGTGITVTTLERDTSDEFVELVATGELDLAVVRTQALRSTLDSRPLAREPLAAQLPPGHHLSGRVGGAFLRDLAGEPLIAMPAGSSLRDAMDAAFARVGIAANIAIEARHLASVWAMVRAGLGVSVLPALAIDPRLPSVLLRDQFLHREMAVAWRYDRPLDPVRKTVVNAMVRVAAERYEAGQQVDHAIASASSV